MNLLDEALKYAGRGWRVFPVLQKKPLEGSHGFLDASSDATVISKMQWLAADGIGLATGFGLVILDVDPRHDGPKSLARLVSLHGPLPKTVYTRTGGGGEHYCFTGSRSSGSAFLPGIDIKSLGGYVVIPPSMHPSGMRYEWGLSPDDNAIAPAPDWLMKLTRHKPEKALDRKEDANPLDGASEGSRNDGLASYVGRLIRFGLSRREAETLALKYAENCKPPLESKEASAVVSSIWKIDSSKPKPASIDHGGSCPAISDPAPWNDPIPIGEDLLDLIARSLRRFVVLPKYAAEALALWVVHTHTIDASEISPKILLSSPAPRCGKTTCIDALARMVCRPLVASSMTAAVMFRLIDKAHPSLLLDEVDAFLKDNEQLRGIINAGHRRGDANVARCVGDGSRQDVRFFNAYGPQLLAGIGHVPETIADRSILIPLQRKSSLDRVDKARAKALDELKPIASMTMAWATANLEELRRADPLVPGGLNDRQADNWSTLLAIADLCGPRWSVIAREAAVTLSLIQDDSRESHRELLLADVRDLFGTRDRITSVELAEALGKMEERPWSEWKAGKPITARQIAAQLNPFKIRPKTLKLSDGSTAKGYMRDEFEGVWNRYVPEGGNISNHGNLEPKPFREQLGRVEPNRTPASQVTDPQLAGNRLHTPPASQVTVVTDQGTGEEDALERAAIQSEGRD